MHHVQDKRALAGGISSAAKMDLLLLAANAEQIGHFDLPHVFAKQAPTIPQTQSAASISFKAALEGDENNLHVSEVVILILQC